MPMRTGRSSWRCASIAASTAACDETGHPLDLFRVLEPVYLRDAAALSRQQALPVPIPKLCTLVVASAFDAAIHDAYGKAFGVSPTTVRSRLLEAGVSLRPRPGWTS